MNQISKIKVFDVNRINQKYSEEFQNFLANLIENGYFIMGNNVKEFEKRFADYLNVKHAITTANCGDALIIALKCAGIKPGDDVLVPVNTYIATAFAVSWIGANPILVDIDKDTYTISIDDLKNKLTNKTKAIIPVHLYGYPADMDPIIEFANENDLVVIEDCAQSTNASYKNKKTGTFGLFGCFSFFPTKNLGCLGDGGAIVTNDDEMAEKVAMMRNYGMKISHVHDIVGINSRFDELQAGFLLIKMRKFDDEMQRRKKIAERYLNEINSNFIKPPFVDFRKVHHAWHIFAVRVKNRDKFIEYMKSKNIEVLIHYPKLIHQQLAYSNLRHLRFPIAEEINKEIVTLPLHQDLTEEEVNYIIDTVNKYKLL